MYNWQFSSRQDRPQSWYILALIVVGFLIIYGIWEELYMMSIVTFLFAGVYIMKENNSAPVSQVSISEHGIEVQNTFYEYSQIHSFAFLYDGQIARVIRIFLKKGITSTIDIPLTSEVNAREVKDYLLAFITEDTNAEFTKSDRMIQAMRL